MSSPDGIKTCLRTRDLDSQALTAFGAASRDHCATTARFHTGEKTVRACAFNFRWLVRAFHDQSYWLENLPLHDSCELGGSTVLPALQGPPGLHACA
jgi:hypothetical protein